MNLFLFLWCLFFVQFSSARHWVEFVKNIFSRKIVGLCLLLCLLKQNCISMKTYRYLKQENKIVNILYSCDLPLPYSRWSGDLSFQRRGKNCRLEKLKNYLQTGSFFAKGHRKPSFRFIQKSQQSNHLRGIIIAGNFGIDLVRFKNREIERSYTKA